MVSKQESLLRKDLKTMVKIVADIQPYEFDYDTQTYKYKIKFKKFGASIVGLRILSNQCYFRQIVKRSKYWYFYPVYQTQHLLNWFMVVLCAKYNAQNNKNLSKTQKQQLNNFIENSIRMRFLHIK